MPSRSSLVDIPNVVPDASFVQVVEPPPPPGIEQAKGVVTIPANPKPAGWGKGLDNLFDISQLDQIPVPTAQIQPQYPYEMRRAGITGEVNVGFIVNVRGEVQDAYVMNSTASSRCRPCKQSANGSSAPGAGVARSSTPRCQSPSSSVSTTDQPFRLPPWLCSGSLLP